MFRLLLLLSLSVSGLVAQMHPLQELIEAARTNSPRLKDLIDSQTIAAPSDITVDIKDIGQSKSVELYSQLIKMANAEISKVLLSESVLPAVAPPRWILDVLEGSARLASDLDAHAPEVAGPNPPAATSPRSTLERWRRKKPCGTRSRAFICD